MSAKSAFSGPAFDGVPGHRCPDRCHRCAVLVAIAEETDRDAKDEMVTTMPMCMGGVMYGLSGCHCWNRKADADERRWMRDKRRTSIGHLARLIREFPDEARRLLAGDVLEDVAGRRNVKPHRPTLVPTAESGGDE